MAKWFCLIDGQQSGPLDPAALKHLATSGQLKPTNKVRREDIAQWVPAVQVKGLFASAPSHVTTAPTPTATITVPAQTPGATIHRNDNGNGALSTRPSISQPASPMRPQLAKSQQPLTNSDNSFGSWYGARLGKQPLLVQIICWLFYGYVWIPAWWLVSRITKNRSKLVHAVVYGMAAFFLLGLMGLLISVSDPPDGTARHVSTSSDERNRDLLIAGIAVLGGNKAVESVSVSGNSATITVATGWHYSPYQVRLQAAQNLWKLWSKFAPSNNPDEARISLVDLNGNEVGGSRVWGGSLIWVQQD